MTAYSSFADYLARVGAPAQRVYDQRASFTSLGGRTFSSWLFTGSRLGAGSAPSGASVPNRNDPGAIGQDDAIVELRVAMADTNRNGQACLVLCDRLSHQGGLSGTVTTAQTTNLPTAALTRYTSGDGVFAGLEIYSAIGSTGTTVQCSYTNQAGTTGRTTEATDIGGANYSTVSRFIILPLQKGDTGVRAVANVDLVASTGTAGNFGVTLFKPLMFIPFPGIPNFEVPFDSMLNLGGQCPQILSGACLFWLAASNSTFGGQSNVLLTMTDEPLA